MRTRLFVIATSVVFLAACGAQKPATEKLAQGVTAPGKPGIKPIPEGYFSVTPNMVVVDVARALDFYKAAFGATLRTQLDDAAGNVTYAEIQIGDSLIMLSRENSAQGKSAPTTLGGTTGDLLLYVVDADAVVKAAAGAGATVLTPPEDAYFGDRYARIVDPMGHEWAIATHKEDLTVEQIDARVKVALASFPKKPKKPGAVTKPKKQKKPKWEPGTPAPSHLPEGYHTVTAELVVDNAVEAIEFYKQAFSGELFSLVFSPDGRIARSTLRIGDVVINLSDAFPELDNKSAATAGGSPVSLLLYVENADEVFYRAVSLRAAPKMAPQNMYWGDRYGELIDPYGYKWAVATHIEDLTPLEIQTRAKSTANAAAK